MNETTLPMTRMEITILLLGALRDMCYAFAHAALVLAWILGFIWFVRFALFGS